MRLRIHPDISRIYPKARPAGDREQVRGRFCLGSARSSPKLSRALRRWSSRFLSRVPRPPSLSRVSCMNLLWYSSRSLTPSSPLFLHLALSIPSFEIPKSSLNRGRLTAKLEAEEFEQDRFRYWCPAASRLVDLLQFKLALVLWRQRLKLVAMGEWPDYSYYVSSFCFDWYLFHPGLGRIATRGTLKRGLRGIGKGCVREFSALVPDEDRGVVLLKQLVCEQVYLHLSWPLF